MTWDWTQVSRTICEHSTLLATHIYQPLRSGRIWHKVIFKRSLMSRLSWIWLFVYCSYDYIHPQNSFTKIHPSLSKLEVFKVNNNCKYFRLRIRAGNPRGVEANVLTYCDILASSVSSRSITFTFGLIPLGKLWTPLSPHSYALNRTVKVLFTSMALALDYSRRSITVLLGD